MTEAEHTRLAAIKQEYESMGLTPKWVDEYTRLSVFYLDPATDLPNHNGAYIMLPEGTIPHKKYTEKLDSLIKSMEDVEGRIRAAKRFKSMNLGGHTEDEYIRCFGKGAYEQEVSKHAQLSKQRLKEINEIQHDLRMHLTKYKPINAEAFHGKMRALIKEEIRILTNVRINEASMAAHLGSS